MVDQIEPLIRPQNSRFGEVFTAFLQSNLDNIVGILTLLAEGYEMKEFAARGRFVPL